MKNQLQEYLYAHIPISQAIGIKVEQADTENVLLSAPFSNNINHKKTVFGGSLHAVLTLACWSLLYVKLKSVQIDAQIVITKSDVDYLAPVDSDFKAECFAPGDAEWKRFLKILQAKGKARIKLSAKVYNNSNLSCDYHAVFAAIS